MNDIKTILMMGRPGSGKGTQGKLLAKKMNAALYSSGNRLREMAKGEGFVAKKVKAVMETGDLLPAWFSSHLFVEEMLNLSPQDAVIFEGACRRLEEAQDFDQVAAWLERPYKAVFLNISDEEVEKRLAVRRGIEGRSDDASDTVEHRLEEYKEATAPVIEFLKSKGALIEVFGERSIEDVHLDVLKTLNIA